MEELKKKQDEEQGYVKIEFDSREATKFEGREFGAADVMFALSCITNTCVDTSTR